MRIGFLLLIAALFPLGLPAESAVRQDRRFDQFPTVVARIDGSPVERSAVLSGLRPEELPPAGSSREELAAFLRKRIDQLLYRRVIDELLRSAGWTPSRELAARHLSWVLSLLPHGLSGMTPEAAARLVNSPDYQLNVALHYYFAAKDPQAIQVDDQEIERFYRLHQQEYLVPERVDLAVLRIDRSQPRARESAEDARARLLQGEAFERVAAELDPEGRSAPSPELIELVRSGKISVDDGKVGEVVELPDGFYVVMGKGRVPPYYVSLEEATPYLRQQLMGAKVGRALEALLRRELAKRKIEYFLESHKKMEKS